MDTSYIPSTNKLYFIMYNISKRKNITYTSIFAKVVNGKVKPQSVKVRDVATIDKRQTIQDLEASWPLGFHVTIPKKIMKMSVSRKYIMADQINVFYIVTYSRVIDLQARRCQHKHQSDLELAPIPVSMFKESGDMRIATAKSPFKPEISTRNIFGEITCRIIDASTVLRVVQWPANDIIRD